MIGQKIIFKETLDSTNNYAAILLDKGELKHGTVIMSGEQTQGRGQRGATWAAEPYKNLIFTCFIEHDNLSVNQHQAITHFVSLSVIHLLKSFQIHASIKWPNDILVGNAKIAGILIENQIDSKGIRSSIIGIGLNVNQIAFGPFNATSLKAITQQEYVLEHVYMGLISAMNELYPMLKLGKLEQLKHAYLQHLWLLNQTANFEDQEGVFEGMITGVTEAGRLCITKADSTEKTYDLKEITFLNRNAAAI
jgi:BirA family biotin operon repressor/biotin-[acetyl-CoA-carboxylase] ligase